MKKKHQGVVTGFWYYETASKWDIFIRSHKYKKFTNQLEFRSLFDKFLPLDLYSLAGLLFFFCRLFFDLITDL